ncbi:MAG: PAS domain-containing protein [Deltaproteobacteria bacterium]|nr:PAS domain-containing protein [Deltaproteobacteria bacterium]
MKPYYVVPVVIITSGNVKDKIGLNELRGWRVGTVTGYAVEEYLIENNANRFHLIGVNSVPEGLRKVSSGEIDAFVENLGITSYYIEKEGIPNLRIAGDVGYKYAVTIGVSRKYPLLASSVDKALNSISRDELDDIINKWISSGINRWLDLSTVRALKVISLFILLLISGLIIITIFLKRKLNRELDHLRHVKSRLSEKSELLQLITEVTPIGAWDFNPVKGTGYLEDQWYIMFGYEPIHMEIKLDEMDNYICPDDLESSRNELMNYVRSGGKGLYESKLRIRNSEGKYCWVLARGRAVEWDANGIPKRVIGMHINIHDLITAEENLKISEERFRSLFMRSPIPLANVTVDGKILEVNEGLTKFLGYTLDDIPDLDHLWPVIYPDAEYREKVLSDWGNLIRQVIAGNTDIEQKRNEYRIRCKDGTDRVTVIFTNIISGTILLGFLDITDRRRAEEEKHHLQEQLFQSQRLESMGILAGGIAHDFNNMLGIIIGYAELAMTELTSGNSLYDYFEQILDAARKSANLTRQLLTFARSQSTSPELFNMNELIDSMLKMLQRLIGENIKLSWSPSSNPCMVEIDRSQFEQILMNLCVNSKDAIRDVGKISIHTEEIFFDETYSLSHSESAPGHYILLSISDTGCGMDAKTKKHIFDPFFTTKGQGKGTGLGLSTVYGIIKQNMGFINVYSEPGKGSVFNIYIPRFSGESKGALLNTDDDIPKGRGEVILIVEDDPAHLSMITRMLGNLGYSVVSANSPASAIKIMKENNEIDMFITDVIMPEMNGGDLAARLLEIRPSVKYFFMSGYTPDIYLDNELLEEGAAILQKPFSLRNIAQKIRKMLD